MPLTRDEVLRVFVSSRENETAVGLRIKGRKSLLITTIEEIRGHRSVDTVIIVNQQTIYGEFLIVNQFELSEVESIFCLRVSYNDPFYMHLRRLRSNIRHIRENSAGLAAPL